MNNGSGIHPEDIGHIFKRFYRSRFSKDTQGAGLGLPIREIDSALENLWLSLEKGKAVDMITERINKRQKEKDELLKQLAIEENKCFTVSEMDVKIYLDYIKNLPDIDISKRRVLINIFVNSIYLYDDRMTIIFNASNKKLSQVDIPFDDIEAKFSKIKGKADECLSLTLSAPPKTNACRKYGERFVFLYYFSLLYKNGDKV